MWNPFPRLDSKPYRNCQIRNGYMYICMYSLWYARMCKFRNAVRFFSCMCPFIKRIKKGLIKVFLYGLKHDNGKRQEGNTLGQSYCNYLNSSVFSECGVQKISSTV